MHALWSLFEEIFRRLMMWTRILWLLLLGAWLAPLAIAQTVLSAVDIGATGDDTGLTRLVGVNDWGWGAASTVDGRTVRSLDNGAIDAENVQIDYPTSGGTILFTYKDDPALSPGNFNLLVFIQEWDGDNWRDKVLGLLPLDGMGRPGPNGEGHHGCGCQFGQRISDAAVFHLC
jgi:hypothetical protein